VIEPARVSRSPVFPSRLHLSLIAFVMMAVVGVGAALAADMIRPTVNDVRSLRLLSGHPVLGTVSMLVTEEDRIRQHRANWWFGAAVVTLFVLQGAWATWFAMVEQIH
jgi:hypothetical protein